MTRVSVIIPSYNASSTIKNAIDSVLNQSYENVECLIIDGASKDNTIEIVQSYGNKVRYVSEPDNGIYDAMNKGWRIASGEWVLFLGADDILLPNAINLLITESHDYDIVYGDVLLKFPNGVIKNKEAISFTFLPKISCCCHQSLIMKKKCLIDLNGFNTDYKILSDYDLLLRAYKQKHKFLQINETISCFQVGGASSSYKNIFESIRIHKSNNNKSIFIYYYAILGFLRKTYSLLKNKHVKNI